MLRRDQIALVLVLLGSVAPASRADFYVQTNLVSDLSTVGAKTVDVNLRNPWGVSNGTGGPFWVSNAGSDTSTLYDGLGNKLSLTVAVPGGPTGQVFNNTTGFVLPSSAGPAPASFIFDTLGGGIYAWNNKAGVVTEVTGTGATYTGLSLGNSGAGNVLYAADNLNNKVDVYGSSFKSLSGGGGAFAGKFVDPNGTGGLSVFNVVNLNGSIYVTYNSNTLGGGIINQFDTNGNFIARIANNTSGGPLAGPWSLALAPLTFGKFGGDLLVSNNDNGTIAALNPTTGAFLGDVMNVNGNPLVNDGIWTIGFGTGVRNGDPNSLYIFAGINGEVDGLIARISVVPEPSSIVLVGIGGAFAFAVARRRQASGRA